MNTAILTDADKAEYDDLLACAAEAAALRSAVIELAWWISHLDYVPERKAEALAAINTVVQDAVGMSFEAAVDARFDALCADAERATHRHREAR